MTAPPFATFYASHRDDVYRFLVARVGRAEADDCLQETFVAALRHYRSLDGRANVRAWLFTIAERKAIDAHRSRGRRPRPTAQVDDGPAPDHTQADDEVWAAVRNLPPQQRTATVLRFVNDLPYREIAQIAGTTEEAARRNVHEALKKLREGMRR